MVEQTQKGNDLVFQARSRGTGSRVVELLRLGLNRDGSPKVTADGLVQKRTLTIRHDTPELVAEADNGDAVTLNIGAPLPANSRILGVDMRGYTPFTGGGATAVTVDVGTTGDIDAIVDGADVFAAAVDGGPATMPAGIRPNKTFAAGAQLIATIDPDALHNLADLTAGEVTIDVLFTVLP